VPECLITFISFLTPDRCSFLLETAVNIDHVMTGEALVSLSPAEFPHKLEGKRLAVLDRIAFLLFRIANPSHYERPSQISSPQIRTCAPTHTARSPLEFVFHVRPVHRYFGAVRLLWHILVRSATVCFGPTCAGWPKAHWRLAAFVHVVSSMCVAAQPRRTGQPIARTQPPDCFPLPR
jgi:hypothetical protein